MRIALLAFAFALALGHAAEDEVFVVSDIYGILPDGKVLETQNGEFGDLRKKNVHWDAAAKTIHLVAAKNEEVAVQVVIPRKGKAYSGRMSDLSGPGSIPAARAAFSAMAWVHVKHPGSKKKGKEVPPLDALAPDLVVPLDGSVKGIRSFDVPLAIANLPQPGNAAGVMLFEIWVPKDAPAGAYKGALSVLEGEQEIASLNVQLEVFDFALPDMPTYTFDLLTYNMPSNMLKLGGYLNADGLGKPATPIAAKAKELDYQACKLAMDHRTFINLLPYHSQRGHPRYAPPIEGKGAAAKVMSFQEWDDYFGPILDGKCNKFGQPPAHFTLAFNSNYPHLCEGEPKRQFNWMPFKAALPEGPGKDPKLKEFEETNKAVAEQYVAHFAEKGWTKTRFEVYHNQKANPERSRLPWKLDEPCAGTDYQALRYFFNTAHWAFASAKDKGVQVVTRIDIGHFHCDTMHTPDGKISKCYKAKEYDTHHAQDLLKDCTDHWCISGSHSEGACHRLKEYEHENVRFIRYGFNKRGILMHLGEYAGEGYKSARMGYSGRVLYQLNPVDPNNYDLSSSTVYSAQCLGADMLLAPHRLKLWRNAVNDYEYIAAARKKDAPAAEAIVEAMTKLGPSLDASYRDQSNTKGYWPTNNVEDFFRAKVQLAHIVLGKPAPAGTKLEGFSDAFAPCGSADDIVGYD